MSRIHDHRMAQFVGSGIYLVTSEAQSAGRSTLDVVRMALDGGMRLVQLREKNLPIAELTRLARDVRELTARAGAVLIINDHIDIALAVGADGVHLGLDDMPLRAARERAPDLVLGASTHNVAEALEAQEAGASYINIGPLFETKTKNWTGAFLGLEGLREIGAVARIPFTVMGGIKPEHIPELRNCGARVVAVVTAITAADDPRAAAEDLLGRMKEQDEG